MSDSSASQARAETPFLEGRELRCAGPAVPRVAAAGRPALGRMQGFEIGTDPGARRERESAVVKVANRFAWAGGFRTGQLAGIDFESRIPDGSIADIGL